MKRTFQALSICMVLLAGCGKTATTQTQVAGAQSTPVLSPTSGFTPAFHEQKCDFQPPEGVRAICGTVTVPENRSRAFTDANRVDLAVMVLQSPGTASNVPPTLLLGGGPGQDVIGLLEQLFEEYQRLKETGYPEEQYPGHLREMERFVAVMDGFTADLRKRAYLLLDQRGAGYSTPSLKCHGEVLEACRARLVQAGVDLAAYSTMENAADVNDVRQALGYKQVNLSGGSYGTRLALEVMRRYPQTVRAVVLDGVAPPQIDWGVEMVRRYGDSLEVIFDHCRTDPACDRAYPDLEAVFYRLVERLNEHPIEVRVGSAAQIHNGDDLLGLVRNAMYDANLIRFLPMLIGQVDQGSTETWGNLLAGSETSSISEEMAWGMHYSVDCPERWAFQSVRDMEEAAQALHPAIREAVVEEFASTFYACAVWNLPTAPAVIHTAVRSNIPTLLISGEFDPGTPPAFAEMAAESLSHAYTVVMPYRGHTDGFTSPCQHEIMSAFLDDPSKQPDTACLAEMEKDGFFIAEQENERSQ